MQIYLVLLHYHRDIRTVGAIDVSDSDVSDSDVSECGACDSIVKSGSQYDAGTSNSIAMMLE